MSEAIWKGLLDLDAQLGKHDVPRLSDVWLRDAERFYLSPNAKLWVACVGRGGAKTFASVKCGIAETLFGAYAIPNGERHYLGHVSENLSEAGKTSAIYAQYFRMLDVAIAPSVETIDLLDLPDRGIKILASRVGAVSGFRCYGWTADENAKWSSDGSNPSKEVVASMRAMTVTHPRARGRMFSSPVGRIGHFYDTLAQGDCFGQIVTQAATWIANPSVTEAQTRELEPDARIWAREYAAIPQAGALAAFDPAAIDRAFAPKRTLPSDGRVLVLDPSSGKKDTWSWGVVGWNREHHDPGYIRFDAIDGIEGSFWRETKSDDVVARVAKVAKDLGITDVHSDQREAFALEAAFRAHGLIFQAHDYTAASKPRAVETVRRWLADDMISLPEHAKLRTELHGFEERATASGSFTFGARGSGHDDFVALLLTAALTDIAGELTGPTRIHAPPPRSNDPSMDGSSGLYGRWAGRRGF
jgi:hypothetical protein